MESHSLQAGPKPLRTVCVLQTGGEGEHLCCHVLTQLPSSPEPSQPTHLSLSQSALVTVIHKSYSGNSPSLEGSWESLHLAICQLSSITF